MHVGLEPVVLGVRLHPPRELKLVLPVDEVDRPGEGVCINALGAGDCRLEVQRQVEDLGGGLECFEGILQVALPEGGLRWGFIAVKVSTV